MQITYTKVQINYKWERGSTPSDPEEYQRVRTWLDDVEPGIKNLEKSEPEVPYAAIASSLVEKETFAMYLREVEENKRNMKEQNEFLQRMMETSLAGILASLVDTKDLIKAQKLSNLSHDQTTLKVLARNQGVDEATYLTEADKLEAELFLSEFSADKNSTPKART